MLISNGVLKKSPTLVWTGSPQTWGNWPTSLQIGNQWASYSTMYRRQEWVRVCVDKRAALLARLPLKVYRHDDLNRPEESDHPYARLLAKPNQRHSRFFFWQWVQSTFDIYGEAFIAKMRDPGGRPYQLVPLHPTNMHESDETDGRVIWDFDNGKVHISGIPDEDLIHPRTYNPDSFTRGLSKLESLRSTLENEDFALRAQSSFWKRGARPGVALTHPGILSQPAADRLKLRWDAIAAGADNTGTTVVLEEGMKPEILQLNAEEAAYIDSRKLNREEVVAGYDMPPPAVHILDHATYSNINAQLRSVYRDTMAPVTIGHEGELETQLRGAVRPGYSEPDFSEDVYAEFLLDGVLRGDFEERADAYQKSINSGWQTPAEVRRLENLPFIEGSDRLYINSTMVPLEVQAEEVEAEAAQFDPALVDAVGTLIRSGFDPTSILAALGLPPMNHLGLLPVTLQREEQFDADLEIAEAELVDDPATLRTVLGRLAHQKTLDEVDPSALVKGLNGLSPVVLHILKIAKAAGDDLAGFRDRLKALKESGMPRHVPGRCVCSVEWCEGLAHGGGYCTTHYRQIRLNGELAPWRQVGEVRVRPCEGCSEEVASKSGLARLCEPCKRERNRLKVARYNASNPERVRQTQRNSTERLRADPERRAHKAITAKRRRLLKDYGMTIEQYDALVEEQLGFCAICHRNPGPRGLDVDHDHRTGEVRGLLCSRCNTGLGLFADLPLFLYRAAAYLEDRGGAELSYFPMTIVSAS